MGGRDGLKGYGVIPVFPESNGAIKRGALHQHSDSAPPSRIVGDFQAGLEKNS